MIAKLSKSVQKAADEANSTVDTYLNMFDEYVLSRTIQTNNNMNNSESFWSELLDVYKKKASDKHVDISSCLGVNEQKLAQLYTINSRSMTLCLKGLVNTLQQSRQETLKTVRFFKKITL